MYKIYYKPSLFFLIIILISMAISPSLFLGEGNRNLLLIGIMSLTPIIIMNYFKFYKSDIFLFLFLLSIILIPWLNHPERMRWSTVMYSIMFGLTFIAYKALFYQKKITIKNYKKLLKILIYAYFIVLIIQQFCVLTGLPIFNLSNYDPSEPWKLNSLSAEPSHSARIVALLMYSYITIQELITKQVYNFKLNLKKDKWIWFSFFWTMLTMGSATAFLFIAIIFSKFIKYKNLIILILISIFIFFIVDLFKIHSFTRVYDILIATLTFDIEKIIQADHSASLRIIPMLLIIQGIDLTTLNGWFGYGIDYTAIFLSGKIPGVHEGFAGGGLLQLFIEYGFISFIMFLLFSFFTIFRRKDYIGIIFWFLLVFMNSINSQIVWLTIILICSNNYFHKKSNTVI